MNEVQHTPKPLTPEQRAVLERIRDNVRGIIALLDEIIAEREERYEPAEVAAAYYEAGFKAGKAAGEDES